MRWPNLWYKWAGKGDDEGVGDDGEVGHHLKDLGPHADISEDGGYLYLHISISGLICYTWDKVYLALMS